MSNGPSARTSHELGTPAMLARTKPTVPTKPNGTAFRSNLHELMWGTRPHSLGQVFEHEVLESCLRQRYRKECRNHACIRLRLVPTELPSDAQTSAKVWRQHLKNIEISVGNDQGVNSPQLIERQLEKKLQWKQVISSLKERAALFPNYVPRLSPGKSELAFSHEAHKPRTPASTSEKVTSRESRTRASELELHEVTTRKGKINSKILGDQCMVTDPATP